MTTELILEKIPIWHILLMFGFYFISHVYIGNLKNKVNNELKLNTSNEELKEQAKNLYHLFRWWPAVCVVIIVLIFYSY